MRGIVGDAHRARRSRAAAVADTVIANHEVALGERRLGNQRSPPVVEDTGVNEQDQLAVWIAGDFKLQLETVQLSPRQRTGLAARRWP